MAVPAFSGYPLVWFDAEIISGLTYAWTFYFIAVNSIILGVCGKRLYANIVAAAALISMPVVFLGASIAYLLLVSGWGYPSGQSVYSSHYLSVCITMLTVIPLSLSMVGLVPFQRFEQNLLQSKTGVSKLEKFFLMFLRVFNHIVFFVIQNILETIREEGQYRRWVERDLKSASQAAVPKETIAIKRKLTALIKTMIQLGVEGICASIQFIPLWAVEISQLPDKRSKI